MSAIFVPDVLHDLSDVAALPRAADRLVYYTGATALGLTTFTSFARTLLDDADASTARTTLGLGTAATQNTGTSGANVPLLDANNTYSGSALFQNASGSTSFTVRAGASQSGFIAAFTRNSDGSTAASNAVLVTPLGSQMQISSPFFVDNSVNIQWQSGLFRLGSTSKITFYPGAANAAGGNGTAAIGTGGSNGHIRVSDNNQTYDVVLQFTRRTTTTNDIQIGRQTFSFSPDIHALREAYWTVLLTDFNADRTILQGRADGTRGTLAIGGGAAFQSILSATATLDFGSIAAGATAELTITVTGAATGDTVELGPPATLDAGLIATGYVSASNTVTVRLHNTTGSSIDPVSATWRATVIKY